MYVKNLVDQLQARGQYTNDLLVNLFKGYLSATDRSFTTYIEKKLEAYDEGQDNHKWNRWKRNSLKGNHNKLQIPNHQTNLIRVPQARRNDPNDQKKQTGLRKNHWMSTRKDLGTIGSGIGAERTQVENVKLSLSIHQLSARVSKDHNQDLKRKLQSVIRKKIKNNECNKKTFEYI